MLVTFVPLFGKVKKMKNKNCFFRLRAITRTDFFSSNTCGSVVHCQTRRKQGAQPGTISYKTQHTWLDKCLQFAASPSSPPCQWSWSWSPLRWWRCSSLCRCHPGEAQHASGQQQDGFQWGCLSRRVGGSIPQIAAAGRISRLPSRQSRAPWTNSH